MVLLMHDAKDKEVKTSVTVEKDADWERERKVLKCNLCKKL